MKENKKLIKNKTTDLNDATNNYYISYTNLIIKETDSEWDGKRAVMGRFGDQRTHNIRMRRWITMHLWKQLQRQKNEHFNID